MRAKFNLEKKLNWARPGAAGIQEQCTYKMEAITEAVNSLVERKLWRLAVQNEAHVERLKKEEINTRKARAAAVAWRLRYDEMVERAEKAERALEELRREGALETQPEQPLPSIAEETESQLSDECSEAADAVREPIVTVYEGINYPTVSTAGPDIEKLTDVSYEEALAKARELNCSVMVKKVKGNTWYLRGQDIEFETLKKNIDGLSKQKLKHDSRTRTLYLIKQ